MISDVILEFCLVRVALCFMFLTLLVFVVVCVLGRILGSALDCVSSLRSTSWLSTSSTPGWRSSRSSSTGERLSHTAERVSGCDEMVKALFD